MPDFLWIVLIVAAVIGVGYLVYRSRKSRTIGGTGYGGPRSINRDTRPR